MSRLMYDRIVALTPTYGRAHTLLPQYISSCKDKADSPEKIFFTLVVNENDCATRSYIDKMQDPNIEYILENESLPHLSKYWNMAYTKSKYLDDHTVIGYMGDDMLVMSQGWDRKILNTMMGCKGCVGLFCDDDYLGALNGMPTNLFLTKKLVEASGKPYMHPGFFAEGSDWVWQQILEPLGLLYYLEDVQIAHRHATKTNDKDGTYDRLQQALALNKVTRKEVTVYIHEAVASIKKNLRP